MAGDSPFCGVGEGSNGVDAVAGGRSGATDSDVISFNDGVVDSSCDGVVVESVLQVCKAILGDMSLFCIFAASNTAVLLLNTSFQTTEPQPHDRRRTFSPCKYNVAYTPGTSCERHTLRKREELEKALGWRTGRIPWDIKVVGEFTEAASPGLRRY